MFKKHAWLYLDDDKDTFLAGDTVSGTITIDISEATKAKEIILKFRGSGYVSWSVDAGQNKLGHDKTKTIKAESDFLEEFITVWKPGDSPENEDPEDNNKIAAGQHTFPWKFQLPFSLPSSYDGSEGHVKYSVKLNVDRPWAFDWEDHKHINVVGFCNLETYPNSQEQVNTGGFTSAGYGCILRKRIDVKIHQPTRGILVMNKIPLSVEIDNQSPRNISYTMLQLKQICTMKIASHTKPVNDIVFQHKEPGSAAGEKSSWKDVELTLPAVASTGGSWEHLHMQYMFEFIVQTSWNGPQIKVEWPVVIGTHQHSDAVVTSTAVAPPYPTQPGKIPEPYPTQPVSPPPKQQAPLPPVLPGVPSEVTPVTSPGLPEDPPEHTETKPQKEKAPEPPSPTEKPASPPAE